MLLLTRGGGLFAFNPFIHHDVFFLDYTCACMIFFPPPTLGKICVDEDGKVAFLS